MTSTISPLSRQIANAIGECCGARKVPPQDLSSADFFRWLKDDKGLSAEELGEVRGHLSKVGGFSNVRNALFVASPTPSIIEKVEMQGIAKLARANVKVMAYDEMFISRFSEVMSKAASVLAKMPVPTLGAKPKGKEKTARVLNIAISDTHFGSKLDPRELPYRYDFEEEARALASVVVRLCEFKVDHREETELLVWFGGDLTRGKIHDKQAGRAGAEQGADAMWLLTQALRIAAKHFKKVTVYCSSGNHDRDERHTGNAYEEKWDSRATLIYYGIKLAVEHLPNVTVHIPRAPFAEWNVFGWRTYATHGDTNFDPGNPGKNIDISRIANQMANINLAETQRGLKLYDVFVTGHAHQGMHLPLAAGELIINPALIPVDGYARGIGYAGTRPGQTLFETTEKLPVGDLRFLYVPPEVLKDSSLDKVIRPFQDF